MALEGGGLARSPIVGDLHLPPPAPATADGAGTGEPGSGPDDQPVPILVELNVMYPGGIDAVTGKFFQLWTEGYLLFRPVCSE